MARIYLHDGVDSLRIRILGELGAEGAAEVQQIWRTARSTLRGRKLLVDIGGVIAADGAAREGLQRLNDAGAGFITSSAFSESLAREISGRQPSVRLNANLSVWRRLWRRLKQCGRSAQFPSERHTACEGMPDKVW